MISTYIKTQRRINGALTGLMLFAGVCMTGYGAFSIVRDVTAGPPEKIFSDELTDRCEDNLQLASFNPVTDNEGTITALHYTLDAPLLTLSRASVAIQQCVGFEMDEFCMGNECEKNPPFYFTLVPVENSP